MVSFRRVCERDLRRLNEIVNDPLVSQFLGCIVPVSMKATRCFFERCRREKSMWHSIICDEVIVGSVWLRPYGKDSKQAHVADLGVSIAREFWGRDVGDAALRFILNEARKRKFKRVELEVIEGNSRARRLYEKHGFRKEGVKEKSFKIGRKYHNTIMMARLFT